MLENLISLHESRFIKEVAACFSYGYSLHYETCNLIKPAISNYFKFFMMIHDYLWCLILIQSNYPRIIIWQWCIPHKKTQILLFETL